MAALILTIRSAHFSHLSTSESKVTSNGMSQISSCLQVRCCTSGSIDCCIQWYVKSFPTQIARPGVPLKVLDVHVLVNSQQDLNMSIEYDVPEGVIRFRDFEDALGIKVLKYALSTNDAAPGTEDYKVAVGTKALPPNITSLWSKAKREGPSFLPAWIKLFVLVNVNVSLCRGLLSPFKALTKHRRSLDGLAVFVPCLQKPGKVANWWHRRQATRVHRSKKRQLTFRVACKLQQTVTKFETSENLQTPTFLDKF